MNTTLSKHRNTFSSDILKILVIDTLWVVLVIGLTGLINTMLPETIDSANVNIIGYLFGVLLIGAIVWLRIKPQFLPIGGLYIGGLILVLRLLLPSSFLDIWGLAKSNGGFLDLSANVWTVIFCINTVLSQLFGRGFAWLYQRMHNAIKSGWLSRTVWFSNNIGFKWLRLFTGQLVWFSAVSGTVVGSLLLYTAAFTHSPVWFTIGVFTITVSAFLFPLLLHSWKDLIYSIPITILFGCAIAFISPLDELLGSASILHWMYYDISPAMSAIVNIGTTLVLETLSLLAWRVFQRNSKMTK